MAHAMEVSKEIDLDELELETDEITEDFIAASKHLQTIVSKLDDKVLLSFYGYYKQGTEGPCNSPTPNWYNIKGKAKWEAWNKLGNMSEIEAKLAYIKLMEYIDSEYKSRPTTTEGWVRISTMHSEEKILKESEKLLVDYVKEGNTLEVNSMLERINQFEMKEVLSKLDDNGLGLIHWAADRGFSEVLNTILSYGGNVNLLDSDKQTALHYAASCGHLECIDILLKSKADLTIKDADGLDPIAVANDDAVKKLLTISSSI